jgi:hypothetical protein
MAFDLLIEFPILPSLAEQAAKSENPFAKFPHKRSGFIFKSRGDMGIP